MYKWISFGLLCVLVSIFGFLCFSGYAFYQVSSDNIRLTKLKDNYLKLCEEIELYKYLKNQYELVLVESNGLEENKNSLKEMISNLESEIGELEAKIISVNKKIKDLS